MAVENGNTVQVHYTGTTDGEVFDSSKDRDPLEFTVGARQVIPGFEEAVKGMEVGEKKSVTIPAKQAYGDTRAELVQDVPAEHLPEGAKAGMMLSVQIAPGQQIPAKIVSVDGETAKLDMNHPLAGKDLTFDLELVNISEGKEGCGDDCDCAHGDEDCGDDCDCKDDKDSCGCGHEH